MIVATYLVFLRSSPRRPLSLEPFLHLHVTLVEPALPAWALATPSPAAASPSPSLRIERSSSSPTSLRRLPGLLHVKRHLRVHHPRRESLHPRGRYRHPLEPLSAKGRELRRAVGRKVSASLL